MGGRHEAGRARAELADPAVVGGRVGLGQLGILQLGLPQQTDRRVQDHGVEALGVEQLEALVRVHAAERRLADVGACGVLLDRRQVRRAHRAERRREAPPAHHRPLTADLQLLEALLVEPEPQGPVAVLRVDVVLPEVGGSRMWPSASRRRRRPRRASRASVCAAKQRRSWKPSPVRATKRQQERPATACVAGERNEPSFGQPRAATERQRGSDQQRPAWPGSAMHGHPTRMPHARIPYPSEDDLDPDTSAFLAKLAPLNIFRLMAGAGPLLPAFGRLGNHLLLESSLDPLVREAGDHPRRRAVRCRQRGAAARRPRPPPRHEDELLAAAPEGTGAAGSTTSSGPCCGSPRRSCTTCGRPTRRSPRARRDDRQLQDLTMTIGFYMMVSRYLRTFDVELEKAR